MKIVSLAQRARELQRRSDEEPPPPRQHMRWLTLALVFVATVLITSPTLWAEIRSRTPERAGETLAAPVIAAIDFPYLDPRAEVKWEEERLLQHERIFQFDSRVEQENLQALDRFLGAVANNDADARLFLPVGPEGWSDAEVADLRETLQRVALRDAVRKVARSLYGRCLISEDEARYVRHRDQARIRWEYDPPDQGLHAFSDEEILDYPGEAGQRITADLTEEIRAARITGLTPPQFDALARLARSVLRPNLSYDEEASEEARLAYPRPDRFTRTVERGTILAGGKIDEAEAHMLAAYRGALLKANALRFGAQALFVLMAFLIIAFFVRKFVRELQFTTNSVLLLSLPVLLALVLGRILLVLVGDTAPYAAYAFPAGVIGILGVLLIDVRMALMLVTWGCVLFGLQSDLADLRQQVVIVGLFGGYAAVAALFNLRERREVLLAGLLIGLVNGCVILLIRYIAGWTGEAWSAAAVGALGGILCPLIAFAVLPVFEVAFRITTDVRLLELTGLEHPLLRKLEESAPGTWQHTLNVAKLAESAALEIGVNYLLVRAGCLFHDVGKMTKPQYFTENQITPEDRRLHEELRPQMSTLVIRNHVKEGLELARRWKLPAIVADFIPQHHGTSLIQYFYIKALTAYEKGEIKEPVREEDYRYPGPKPQSIEAALVMLADAVEATAHAKLSGRQVRDDDIQMLVRNAIFEKFNDGQFDHCNLTMRDLNTIRESFVRTLRGRFHSRIDYPRLKREAQSEKREEKPAESGVA